jgi:cytochrome c-type biogenesis protein CcmH
VSHLRPFICALLAVVLAGAVACDRRVEPFDPDEKPEEPDLSRIFPPEVSDPVRPTEAPSEPPAPPGGRGGPAAPSPAASAAVASGPPIRGTVRVSPEHEQAAGSGGVLFIIARGPGGGPPLAARRIEAPRFPLEYELGPEDRMIQTRPFVGPLYVSARLDSDGNATTRGEGDLQGTAAAPAQPGASGVDVVLNERL